MSPSPRSPANLVTLASVASATVALGAPELGWSAAGTLALTVTCIGASLICDRIDGPLARRLGASSVVGARLDSLADLLAFGAAPALLTLRTAGGGAAWAAALAYLLAAAWRLARYDEDELQPGRWGPVFRGLPTSAAAAAVAVAAVLTPTLLVPTTAAAALLMPSSLRYPKRGPGAWPWLVLVPLAVLMALARALGGA